MLSAAVTGALRLSMQLVRTDYGASIPIKLYVLKPLDYTTYCYYYNTSRLYNLTVLRMFQCTQINF